MYLNKGKVIFYKILLTLELWIGGFFILFTCSGILSDFIEREDMVSNLYIYFLLLSPSGFIIFDGISRQKSVNMAKAVNNQLLGNKNGFINLSSLALIFEKSEQKILKSLNKAVKKGLLINCHIEAENLQNGLCIAANNRVISYSPKEKYKVVVCPNCNASNSIKVGTVGKCQYCDSYLNV